MRIFQSSWSSHHQPHNVEVVNRGMRDAARAVEGMYVVDGYSRELPRYFDEPQHCVPSDIRARMGLLWTEKLGSRCTSLDERLHRRGSGCIAEARRDTAKGISACMPRHDLHFTARGQIGVGYAFFDELWAHHL